MMCRWSKTQGHDAGIPDGRCTHRPLYTPVAISVRRAAEYGAFAGGVNNSHPAAGFFQAKPIGKRLQY
jgi:hypothetical protein